MVLTHNSESEHFCNFAMRNGHRHSLGHSSLQVGHDFHGYVKLRGTINHSHRISGHEISDPQTKMIGRLLSGHGPYLKILGIP